MKKSLHQLSKIEAIISQNEHTFDRHTLLELRSAIDELKRNLSSETSSREKARLAMSVARLAGTLLELFQSM